LYIIIVKKTSFNIECKGQTYKTAALDERIDIISYNCIELMWFACDSIISRPQTIFV